MSKSLCGKVLLVSVWLLMSARGWAQAKPQGTPQATPVFGTMNFGLTYLTERAEIAPNSCNCFWMQGAGLDATYNLPKGIGLVGSISGGTAANVKPGISVNKMTYLGGGKYTRILPANVGKGKVQLFGEGLFGVAHGFNGAYPVNGVLVPSANSFALQLGGGIDIFPSQHIGIRVLQADFVRTALPNSFNNSQDDFRLAFGVVFHLDAFSKRH